MNSWVNILRIKIVYDALEELNKEVIFIGGATVSLYGDRPSGEVRPTDDIDILIELLDYKGYAGIEEKLRKKGFINDTASNIICRYIVRGITVDVMPISGEILGFSNKWYKDGFANSMEISVAKGYVIKIFKPEYFIATKLEAYKGRGENDGRTSTDFEDLIYVLNNRTSIWEELENSPLHLREYLQTEFSELLSQPYIDEWISCHLDYSEQRSVNYIIGSLTEFVDRTSE